MGHLPFGADAGAAGEDVRETAGERQKEGRDVTAKTRGTGVRLRTRCPDRCCQEVAAGALPVPFQFSGRPNNYPEEDEGTRPKADEPVEAVYTVAAEIEYNPRVVAEKRQKLGRFVLATNDLELSPDDLLANYKVQGTVERGLRFLKDPSFRVAEIYL